MTPLDFMCSELEKQTGQYIDDIIHFQFSDGYNYDSKLL